MIVIMYYDWFGTKEALKTWNDEWQKVCKAVEGIKSCKHYTSHQARYHYAWIMEVSSYNDIMEAMGKMTIERDRNALTHAVMEIFTES